MPFDACKLCHSSDASSHSCLSVLFDIFSGMMAAQVVTKDAVANGYRSRDQLAQMPTGIEPQRLVQ